MGVLIPAESDMIIGENYQTRLNVKKWDPQAEMQTRGENEACPFHFPLYTDMESLRKFPNAFNGEQDVVITEKVHGANGRALFKDGRLWMGSHRCVKRKTESDMWWQMAEKFNLEKELGKHPDLVVFFEVFGQVQDLKYGIEKGARIQVFDILDLKTMKYMDWEDVVSLCKTLSLPVVPTLHRGPWSEELKELSEGKSTVAGGEKCIREGFVVKPAKETFSAELGGRKICKLVGQGYLLRNT